MSDAPAKMVNGERVLLSGDELEDFLSRMSVGSIAAVPEVISDRQFAQQLAILGTITEDEAIAWAARGDLPATLERAVSTLPTKDRTQFTARMLLSSAKTYERSHPMTPVIGGLLGYTDESLDELWRQASKL